MEQGEKSRVLRSKWVSGATQMSVPLKKSKTWFPDTGPWHLRQVRQRSCIRMLLQHFYNLRLDWNHQIRLRHPEFYFEMPCALNLRQLLIQPANRFFSLVCLNKWANEWPLWKTPFRVSQVIVDWCTNRNNAYTEKKTWCPFPTYTHWIKLDYKWSIFGLELLGKRLLKKVSRSKIDH